MGCSPHAGVVLQDVVTVEMVTVTVSVLFQSHFSDIPARNVQRKIRGIRLRISNQSHIKHQAPQRGIEIQPCRQAMNYGLSGEVPAVMGKKSMVGQRVQHRTRSSDYGC